MFHQKSSSKKNKTTDDSLDRINCHFNPQYKARSTSQLLSPNSVIQQSISSKNDRSIPHLSTSSLATPTTAKSNISSFFKNSLSIRKTTISQSTEGRFMMTLIKTSPENASRLPSTNSNETSTPSSANDDFPSNTNNKFFKSKVTAALNHVKYRK